MVKTDVIIHKNDKNMKSVLEYKPKQQSNQANNQDYSHIIYLIQSRIITKNRVDIYFLSVIAILN